MTIPLSRTPAGSAGRRALVILHLLVTVLLCPVLPLDAQEIIDPRSGQLVLSVTDLTLQAGPVTLEVRRALETGKRPPGLLGLRWRLNWESRAVSTPTGVVIDETPYVVAFTRAGGTPEYQSVTGERLVLQGDGRFVRTTLSGRTEIFDQQGRLIERDYRNGNKAIVRYGADGRIARIDGPRGSVIQFSADNQGRVVRAETSTGASVRYAYIGDNLTEIQVNGGPILRYAYDGRGALIRINDLRSGTVELVYDARLRVVSRRWADGAKERFEYDDAANRQRRIDPTGAVTVTRFDQDGRRAEVIEPRGGKIAIAFDANGRPESVTSPTGETAKIVYDSLGRAVAFHDLYGQVTRYEYIGATGRVKTIARPDGMQESLAYDPQQNLTEINLGAQTLVRLAYNPDGTVGVAKALGLAEHRLTYDGQARLQTLTNPLGERLQLSYDARGNPLRAVNPLGGVTAWQWDAQDRLVSETDPAGGITRYKYDSSGRLARVNDPLGGVTRFEYDVRGRVVAETDPSGEVTRYEYDRAGRLVKLNSGAASESFRYDLAGNLIEWVERLGLTVQMEYDALGRVTQERWSTGLQVHYRYDARGQVAGIEDSAGRKLEWQHDGRGQIIAQRDTLGAITEFQYDALGNVTGRRDPRGHLKQFAYTADGALARVQEPSGDAAEYRYDAAHRLTEMVRPSGGRSRFTYNGLGHLTQEVDPLGHVRRHQYDVAGRLVASTDAMGRTTRYAYNAAGRLTEKRFVDGKRVTFKYDSVGNLLEADDGAFPFRYQYDREGRRVKVEYPAIKKTIAYEYDAAGLRTKLIGPDRRVTRYEYDKHKQPSAVVLADGKRIGLSYDVQQRLQSIRYPNGLIGTWEYDTAGRVTKLVYVHGSGKPISVWTYHYDPDGNLVRQKDTEGRDTTYSYDASGQLTEVVGSASMVRYRYSRGGGRVAMEAGAGITSYRHDSADRLIEAGPEILTYDLNSNLVRRQGPGGSTSYEYDAEDRLVKVQGPDGKTTTFGYAPTGERVWKRDAGGMTYYLYDGLDLIQELDDKRNVKAAYVHGPWIDQPLAMRREEKSFYYHADRLGSIRVVTDERGGVAATYDYDAFGKLETAHGGVPNPFTYTGREWDESTRLYYYRTRYYDPALGQFLSPDWRPARLNQPLEHNPYLYVRNQPLRFVDPLGLAPEPTPWQWWDFRDARTAGSFRPSEGIRIANWVKNEAIEYGRALLGHERVHAEKQFNRMMSILSKLNPSVATANPAQQDELWSKFYDRYENRLEKRAYREQMEILRKQDFPDKGKYYADALRQHDRYVQKEHIEGPGRKVWSGAGSGSAPARSDLGPRALAAEGAAAAEAEVGAAAGLRGRLPSVGTVVKAGVGIAFMPALEALVAAVQAEPGKRLEAAGNSFVASGYGLWESGKIIAGCAVTGAAIGACTPVPGGALIGAGIGAAGPIVKGTIETLVAVPKAIGDLKDELAKGLPIIPLPSEGLGGRGPSGGGPAPFTDRAPGSLAGSVTGGLPGATDGSELPDLSDIPFDPRTAARLPHPLPEHIARAGEQQFGGGIPTQGPTSGGTGDAPPAPQPESYVGPPSGTDGAGGPSTPGAGGTGSAGSGQGVMCYSEKTKEQYWMQIGPCPPPWMKPPAGTTTASQQPGRTPWQGLVPGQKTPGTGTKLPPTTPPTTLPPAKTPPGAQGVDLSGTWHATYSVFPLGNLRFTMTLSRVAAGKWQGALDYVVVDCPEMSFKTPATLQATGVGKVRLTYNTPAKDCPRYVGKIGAGAQQADGTYTSSQMTFGVSPNTVTYTRR